MAADGPITIEFHDSIPGTIRPHEVRDIRFRFVSTRSIAIPRAPV